MLSLIIPTLDEEERIASFLEHLPHDPALDIIVVDGGSRDRTRELIRTQSRPPRLVQSAPGRGIQLNAGAAAARGDTLLFVHCDARLPADFQHQIRTVLGRPGIVAGAFGLAIDAPGPIFRIIETGANLRSRLLSLPYGDQGLFLHRTALDQTGGFPEQPLMEDVEMIKRLRRLGRIGLSRSRIRVSARRWQTRGAVRVTLLNQVLLAAYLLGVDPGFLARIYYGKRPGR